MRGGDKPEDGGREDDGRVDDGAPAETAALASSPGAPPSGPTALSEPASESTQEQVVRSAADAVDELAAIRRLLFGILILLTIVALFFARDVLLPIMLGVLLTLTLSPIVRGLGRWGVPAPVVAVVLISGLGLGAFSGAYLMSDTVTQWVDDAPSMQRRLEVKLTELSASVEKVKEASEKVEKLGESDNEPERVVVQEASYLEMAVKSLAAAGSSLIAAMILALFLLASGDLFYAKLVTSFDRLRDKKKALRVVYDVERRISRYLFTVSVINLGLGLAVGVTMHLIGVPYPYIWGALAFGLNYLPFIGLAVGTGLVAVYSIVSFDSIPYALLAPAAYLGLGSLEGQVITPTIVGRRLELNTVSVLITVVFWTWLWGVAGALMAVPILVLVKVICDNVERFSPFSNFLGARDAHPVSWDEAPAQRRDGEA